jgi:hypothetical protein
VQWNGRDDGGKEAGSGLYLLRIEVGRHYETRRIMLLK